MPEITRKYIETTARGQIVSVDTLSSHAATHLKDEPTLWGLTREVLRTAEVTVDSDHDAVFETDMGRTIGEMDLVDIVPSDWGGPDATRMRWAKRVNRETWTPLVIRDERPKTNYLVVVLKQLDLVQFDPQSIDPRLLDQEIVGKQQLDLYTTYIGRRTPSLPGDRYQTEESLPYWTTHALIWGKQQVDQSTVRFDCPWEGVGDSGQILPSLPEA